MCKFNLHHQVPANANPPPESGHHRRQAVFVSLFFISVVVGLVELKYSSENGNCKRRKPLDGTDGGKCNLGVFFSTLVLSHSSFMVIQSFPIRIKSRLADGNSLGQTPDPRLNFCRVETGGTSMAVYHGSKYGDLAS